MALLDEALLRDLAQNPGEGFKVAADGDLDTVSGLENLKAALFRRLMVVPGTLVHRPTYGVGVKNFLNAPNSIDNQRALAVRIKEQFEQDFRVEEMLGMRVSVDRNNPSLVIIFVKVRVQGFGEAEMDFIPFGETVNGQ